MSKALLSNPPPLSFFASLSDELRKAMVVEMCAIEKHKLIELRKKDSLFSYADMGVVKYSTPNKSGHIPYWYGDPTGEGSASFVKTKDGVLAICVPIEIVINSSYEQLLAVVAHELGHYLSGHLDEKDGVSIPSLYKKENLKAIREGDQDGHILISTKAIIDGGYLEKEYEADLIACSFVGLNNVVAMQTRAILMTNNPLIAIEKINRLRQFEERFGFNVPKGAGQYKLEIFEKPGFSEGTSRGAITSKLNQ